MCENKMNKSIMHKEIPLSGPYLDLEKGKNDGIHLNCLDLLQGGDLETPCSVDSYK